MILFGKEFRLRGTCEACKAKDQTIALLADVVDYHRGQQVQTASQIVRQPPPHPKFRKPHELYLNEDEEDITAALEAGAISADAAERALAQIQAFNKTVELG